MRSRSTVAVLIAFAAVGSVLASTSPVRATAVAAPVVRQVEPVGDGSDGAAPAPAVPALRRAADPGSGAHRRVDLAAVRRRPVRRSRLGAVGCGQHRGHRHDGTGVRHRVAGRTVPTGSVESQLREREHRRELGRREARCIRIDRRVHVGSRGHHHRRHRGVRRDARCRQCGPLRRCRSHPCGRHPDVRSTRRQRDPRAAPRRCSE